MVSITVSNSEQLKNINKYSLFITTPYNGVLIQHIMSCGGKYNPNYKDFEVPINRFSGIKELLQQLNEEFEVLGDPNIKSPTDLYFKTKPYEHQIQTVKYGFDHNCFLLGDEQGLGKSKEIIDLAVNLKKQGKIQHCLIICCVASNKYNWLEEIKIHSAESAHILGSRINNKGHLVEDTTEKKWKDLQSKPEEFFWITNIEALRYKRGDHYVIAELLTQLSNEGTLGMIAADECHKCRNPQSIQGRALLKIDCPRKIAMSGTFVVNKPLDLYVPMKWCGFEEHNWYAYQNHYCTFSVFGMHEVIGYKNLEELQQRLQSCMLRRKKEEVLDLPPKVYKTYYVEMDKEQQKLYQNIEKIILDDIDKIKLSPDPLSMMLRLRQVTGCPEVLSTKTVSCAKLERLKELLQECIENNHKAIIFSQWTTVTNILKRELQQYNPCYITGETAVENRMDEVKEFQNNPERKVIIGTLGAMGTGLTLTAADTVILYDQPWNQAIQDQGVDRAHRVGTKSTVNVITLVTKGTIDESIFYLVRKKGKMADSLMSKDLLIHELLRKEE